jgi:hypothetical protein
VVLAWALAAAPAAHAQLFSDNFTRGTDPGPLTPWLAQAGTWTVTGGVLKGGINPSFSYGDIYITNSFGDCNAEMRLQFPVGAYGGGLGARVNTTSGAHYSAWVYPENSAGGSNVFKLFKFQTWTSFGYTNVAGIPIAQTNLASVGTNFHIVKLTCQTNIITAFFDGVQMLSVTDAEAQPYLTGGVSIDFWTDAGAYFLTADDVVVTAYSTTPVANNDSYTATAGRTLTVAAPGVLYNDAGIGTLRALLATNVAHGALNLSSNGGFTYTAANNFSGTDTFVYRATDGVSTSATATVTLTVISNQIPVANNDRYVGLMNTNLVASPPGVLVNDTDADGDALTAVLVTGPTNGTLALSANGGFTYTPGTNFIGADSFTYRANDGLANSSVATVGISILSDGTLFFDNFTRSNDPGPLAPWVVQVGNWTVTGGALLAGINSAGTYGNAYLTNTWTDYAVEARIQFSTSNAWGGGIGGRLNPATGAHYAAWVYPEGSAGGSNVLKLFEFQTWTTFGYNGVGGAVITQANLPAVGTNLHTVKLAFLTNQISVYFDGSQVISAPDTGPSPYLSGGVSIDMFTDTTTYNLVVGDVVVRPLVANDSYSANENATLTVAAPGVLTNDTEVYGTNLTVVLISGPTNGAVNLNTNGGFTYTPVTNYVGTDTFIYQGNDGQTTAGVATVSLTVNRVNRPPVLPVQTNWTIVKLTTLVVTNTATDPNLPPEALSYQLLSPPAGAGIDTNGIITWTPGERQAPSTNTLTTRVTNNGVPPLSATNNFIVTVLQSNEPPVLPVQTNRTVIQYAKMTVTNTATDPDLDVLTYSLQDAPTNATISASGVITWTPQAGQAPSTNTFTTVVTDTNAAAINANSLSATNTFLVSVLVSNKPPSFVATPPNRTIAPLTTLSVTNSATDPDLPPEPLTYSLLVAPTNAVVDTNTGVITWTPTQAQDQTTNVFTTVVTDYNPLAVNSQNLSATNSFTVIVNGRAVLVVDATSLLAEGCFPTNGTIDPGETVTVLFSLKDIGLGNTTNLVATLATNNGVSAPSGPQTFGVLLSEGADASQPFTFTANGTCGGNITASFQLQDGGLNLGTASVSFVMGPIVLVSTQNFDSVTAPALPSGWTTLVTNYFSPTNANYQSNWVTETTVKDTPPNAAFSIDATNIGLNELDSPPITLPLGPSTLAFKNYYDLENDLAHPTNAYDGGVLEIKVGTNAFVDILAAGASFANGGYNSKVNTNYGNPLAGRLAWSGNTAGFTNTVVNLPISAEGQNIQLRWRCGTDNGVGKSGWRIDSIGVTGYSCCARTPPQLPPQTNQTIAGLSTLIVTNTATDVSAPPNSLTYSLAAPPGGAQIDTNGVITWTPAPAQVPSTNVFTTVVTDSGTPALSATNSFTVIVQAVHNGPVLPAQTNRTTIGLATLVVTNTASDNDVPATVLTYTLTVAPTNAVIDANGVITWTPVVAQVPSTNLFTTVVTDNGTPALSATNSFTVIVQAVHNGPVLPAQTNRTTIGLATLVVTNTASDNDIPATVLTYALTVAPTNAVIDTNGVITWTPIAAQVPSTNVFTTVVTDNGTPALSATNSFTVTVQPVHNGPVLPVQTNRTTIGLATLVVTNTASDNDIPATVLTYALTVAPTNAVIDTNGVITWTPVAAQVPSTNVFTTVVSDNGAPALSETNSFVVTVQASQVPPQPVIQSIAISNNLVTLRWTSVSGYVYRLQYKTNMVQPNWLDAIPDFPATGTTITATNDVANASQRFYRVYLVP